MGYDVLAIAPTSFFADYGCHVRILEEARALQRRGHRVTVCTYHSGRDPEGITVGPILLGAARPVHILTPSATVRRIVNMTALAVADANAPRGQEQTLF